jgi:DNA replication factor GINS
MTMKDLDLVNILRKERNTNELQPLGADFYQRVGALLTGLERELSEIEDPYSVEAQIVEDELKAARGSLNRLIDQRMRKIIKKVQWAGSSSREVAMKGMTPQEEQIYSQMLAAFTRGRESILSQVNHSHTERPLTGKRGMSQEYTLVCMMESVPTFIGVDGRRYSLLKGDLVTLPAVHAKNLCNKNLARELKV